MAKKEKPVVESELSVSQLAKQRGLNPTLVHNRMHRGWSLEKALDTPVRPRKTAKKKAKVSKPKADPAQPQVVRTTPAPAQKKEESYSVVLFTLVAAAILVLAVLYFGA
jgi:pyruvate/2-oxoglutarate dehydrogenase complex dihydrolipoamide acyltransferase (E2) component